MVGASNSARAPISGGCAPPCACPDDTRSRPCLPRGSGLPLVFRADLHHVKRCEASASRVSIASGVLMAKEELLEFPGVVKELLPNATFRVELRSEEHTSELQSRENLVCRLLL